MGSTRRTLLLFLVLSFAHLLLMSVQMQARSGVPLFQAGAFVITIDRGSADGVEPNMAVLGHAGVIGRVINRPTAHAAQVQLLIGHNAGVGGVT